MRNIKVFISSPGDLREARQVVAELLRDFNERPTIRDRYKFSAYLYEEHAPALTGEGPQDVVNEQMLQPRDADIVICMLWSRLGTPLTEINPDTGKPYGSGTEYEFYDAYRAYQRRKRPLVLLYRCSAPPPEGARVDGLAAVTEFFERFRGADAPLRGLYRSFETPEQLQRAISNDIDSQIAHWERPSRRLIDNVVRPFWFVFALLLVLLAALVIALPSVFNSVPPLENAPFNVAIAEFAVDPDSDISEADVEVLTEAFHTNFVTRLDEVRSELPLVVGVWSPEQIGVVEGETPEEREQNAQALEVELRERHNARADIIVYGVIAQRGNRIEVQPEFYVTDNWPEVNELFGRFELASALYAPNIDRARALSGELSNRSQVLAFITQGLVQMIFQQYDEARRAFSVALEINRDIVGQELIYVLRGNASLVNYNQIVASGDGRQAQRLPGLLDDATADFQQAIALNPAYARGYAGLGSVEYLNLLEPIRVRGAWTQLDDAQIDALEATFRMALEAPDAPESADVPTKVAFGLGQVAMLRYLQGDFQAVDEVREQFAQVIADYGEGSNPRVKELAAEATARLGYLERLLGDYEASQVLYTEAIALSDIEERRLLFQRGLLEAQIEALRAQQNVDEATVAYEELLNLAMLPTERAAYLFQYGKMLNEAGRERQAIAVYMQAAALDLTHDPVLAGQIWVELGNLYYDTGDLEASVAAYESAMEADPEGQGHLIRVIEETRAELQAQPDNGEG